MVLQGRRAPVIGGAAVCLACAAAGRVTGATLPVDGGFFASGT
jgi:NAD(P)-dependent dehydrogenase (short-subunit alcohol dehydrogenase family)